MTKTNQPADAQRIRTQALRALALNRTPGYHFAGNFLEISFDKVGSDASCLAIDEGPHCLDSRGEFFVGAVALAADMGMASTVRAALHSAQRTATVMMSLTFTGEPITGRLEARGAGHGFLRAANGVQGLTSVRLTCGERVVGFGTGTFMALEPPGGVRLAPVPMRTRESPLVAPLAEDALSDDEWDILDQIDASIESSTAASFVEALWGGTVRVTKDGASGTLANGPHVGNRVGHVQGGIQIGFAARTACAALPADWLLTSITSSFIRPGEGKQLRARSTILHRGRLTAVVRTQLFGKDRRLVLDVVSQHSSRRD